MSSLAKQAREAMKAKASRLTTADPKQKVDSSNWTPAEPLNTEVKTGMRPVSRRAFKSGGKVTGEKAKANLGKKARNSGGKAITANSLVNRNVKEANEERPGGKAHIGGYKKGGRLKRNSGGDAIKDYLDANPDSKPESMPLPPPRPKNLDAPKPGKFKSPYDHTTQRAKRGGQIEDCGASKSKKADGGATEAAKQMMAKAQKTAGVPAGGLYGAKFAPTTAGSMSPAGALGKRTMKKGGAAHEDIKADKALIKKMVKPSARTGKAIGGAFGEYLSPALMLANAVRGDDKKRGGKAMRKGRDDGGGVYADEAFDAAESARAQSMLSDAASRGKNRITPNDYENMIRSIGENIGHADAAYDQERYRKNGGKAKRTARKEGGGVFSGPGYPGKIPGVVPGGREAHAKGGKAKGKGKTHINIMIAAGKPGMDDMMPPGGPTPPPGMGGRPGGVAPVPMAPPPGEGPGAAPMPMPIPMPMPMAGGAPAGGPPPLGRKSGGRLTKVAHSYKDMEAGAGSGEGRLQKTDIAKFKAGRKAGGKVGHRTYRSYKDMDAGAGSGLGRLEKTEIQAHKK